MLSILVTIIALGFALYLIQTYVPMDPIFKNLISVIVVILILVWLFDNIGMLGGHSHLRL